MFQDLTRKWYAPIPVPAETASRLADAYTALMDRLGANSATEPLFRELQTGKTSNYSVTPLPPTMTSAVMAVLQLMENVFTEFSFEHPLNVQNPRNEGWIATFRNFVQSPILYEQVWPGVRNSYHRGFQEFVDGLRVTGRAESDAL